MTNDMISDEKQFLFKLDASGMRCPMPVLRLRKKLSGMQSGEGIAVTATDPNARHDIPAFCREAGHTIDDITENENDWIFQIIKG